MKINKTVKCLHCGQIIECTEIACVKKCNCGKISINGEIITEGVVGVDYIDISPKLLNENV